MDRSENIMRWGPWTRAASPLVSFLVPVFYVIMLTSVAAAGVVYVGEPPDGTASFETTVSLVEALQDQNVNRIVITSNYSIDHLLDSHMGSPLLIARNLTITGLHGKDVVLDLEFKRALVELCSTCTLTFSNITISNERWGTGSVYDLFLGLPGSKIIADDIYKLRIACTSANHLAQVTSRTKRSSILPGSNKPQDFEFVNITFMGRPYTNALQMNDYTVDVPLTEQEGGPSFGGYALSESRKVRLCKHEVPQSCLDVKSPDACVNQLIDKEEEAEAAAESARTARSLPVVAIAVPVVVAALALLAACTFLAYRWHKQQLRQQLKEHSDPAAAGSGGFGSGGFEGASRRPGQDAAAAGDRGDDDELWMPRGLRRGWHMTYSLTTPLLGAVEDDRVVFGRLLGAGSFGRVYLARWAGRQVAVKVIEHSGDTSAVVENEVKLMMQFNHPNVVRAFRCLTYKHPSMQRITGSSAGRAGSSGNNAGAAAGIHALQHLRGPVVLTQPNLAAQLVASGTGTRSSASSCSKSHSQNNSQTLPPVLVQPQQQQQQQHGGELPAPHFAAAAAAGCKSIFYTPSGKPPEVAAAFGATAGRSPIVPILRGSNNSGGEQQQHHAASSTGSSAQLHNSAAHNAVGGLSGSAGRGSAAGLMILGSLDQQRDAPQQQQQHGAAVGGAEVNQGSTGSLEGCMTSLLLEEPERAETWLITEYCDCGTLGNLVAKLPAPSPEDDERVLKILLLLRDVAEGLKALHEAGVVHGDLNGRNVLVSASAMSPLGVVAKVADLGLSRTIKQHETHRTTNTCGTLSHTAPELLRYGRMGMPADVYAFGITMWELYTGQAAFRSLHYGQFLDLVYKHQQRPSIPAHMPEDYALLVEHCWGADPALRPTVATILQTIAWMIEVRQVRLCETQSERLEAHLAQAAPIALLSHSAPLPHAPAAAAAAAAPAAGCSAEAAVAAVGIERATSAAVSGEASMLPTRAISGLHLPRPALLDTPVPPRGQRGRRAVAPEAATAAAGQDAGPVQETNARAASEVAALGAAGVAAPSDDSSSNSSGEHDAYLTQQEVAASLGLEHARAAAAAASNAAAAAAAAQQQQRQRRLAAAGASTWGGPVLNLAPVGAAACGTWKAYDVGSGMRQQRNAADTKPSQDAAVDMRALRGGLSEPLPLVPDGCNMPLVMEGSAATCDERGECIV